VEVTGARPDLPDHTGETQLALAQHAQHDATLAPNAAAVLQALGSGCAQ
jgi:hypothetical protein